MVTKRWFITANLENGLKYIHCYECKTEDTDADVLLELALRKFWLDDYFPIANDYSPLAIDTLDCKFVNNSGLVLTEKKLKFNEAAFRHYFDLGWSASSKEPNERYTLEQFFEDLDMEEN